MFLPVIKPLKNLCATWSILKHVEPEHFVTGAPRNEFLAKYCPAPSQRDLDFDTTQAPGPSCHSLNVFDEHHERGVGVHWVCLRHRGFPNIDLLIGNILTNHVWFVVYSIFGKRNNCWTIRVAAIYTSIPESQPTSMQREETRKEHKEVHGKKTRYKMEEKQGVKKKHIGEKIGKNRKKSMVRTWEENRGEHMKHNREENRVEHREEKRGMNRLDRR